MENIWKYAFLTVFVSALVFASLFLNAYSQRVVPRTSVPDFGFTRGFGTDTGIRGELGLDSRFRGELAKDPHHSGYPSEKEVIDSNSKLPIYDSNITIIPPKEIYAQKKINHVLKDNIQDPEPPNHMDLFNKKRATEHIYNFYQLSFATLKNSIENVPNVVLGLFLNLALKTN